MKTAQSKEGSCLCKMQSLGSSLLSGRHALLDVFFHLIQRHLKHGGQLLKQQRLSLMKDPLIGGIEAAAAGGCGAFGVEQLE